MKVLNTKVKIIDHHSQIGGAHSNIWRGQYVTQDDPSVQLVVVKVARGVYMQDDEACCKQTKHLIECIVTKTKAWSILNHPYILEILGIFTDITITGAPGTVTYYRPLGNISTFLRDNRGVNKLALVKRIAEGVNYLHLKHIIHGDLTMGNILIHQEGEEFIPQIACSSFTRSATNEFSTIGTTLFTIRRRTPPELLGAENPTTADLSLETDRYTFGMLALEVVTGKPPFYNCTDVQAALLTASGSKPLRYHYAPHAELSDPLWTLLEKCWSTIPLDRPTMDEVCCVLQDVI